MSDVYVSASVLVNCLVLLCFFVIIFEMATLCANY